MAYDVTGTQRLVMRGSVGTYFDRPRPGDAQALAANTVDSVSVRSPSCRRSAAAA